ncbi:MAG: hypothetical protein ABIO16_15555 [Nocardioides sp.]
MSGPVMPLLAVGRVLDVRVAADPASCQATATQLAGLSEACGQAGTRLGSQATVGEDELGGLSGIVYRRSTGDLAARADRLAANSARLAAGLGEYARDIAEVRRLMGEAVAAAAPTLRTTDQAVWSPARPPDPGDPEITAAWVAWHEAVDWWHRARAQEDAAERAWRQVIQAPVPDGPVTYDDIVRPPLPVDDPATDLS